MVDPETAALLGTFAGETTNSSILTVVSSIFNFIWSAIITTVTWAVAAFRRGFMLLLSEIDEDDVLGVQGFVSWIEDLGVIGGIILASIVPLMALVIFGLTLLGLFLFEKYLEQQEKKRMVSCATCQTQIYASAPKCYQCETENKQARQVGVLGQATQKLVTDLKTHKLRLVAKKRCPVCANRLKDKNIRQICSICQTVTFAQVDDIKQYMRHLERNLPKVALITGLLSFIPLFGIIPAIIYYRFSLISSLQGYIPRSTGCLMRWVVRALNIGLISLQPIPFLGMLTLPLMVWTNFAIYRKVISHQQERVFGKLINDKSKVEPPQPLSASEQPEEVKIIAEPSTPTMLKKSNITAEQTEAQHNRLVE